MFVLFLFLFSLKILFVKGCASASAEKHQLIAYVSIIHTFIFYFQILSQKMDTDNYVISDNKSVISTIRHTGLNKTVAVLEQKCTTSVSRNIFYCQIDRLAKNTNNY